MTAPGCPGVSEYGHGLTATKVHAGDCCHEWRGRLILTPEAEIESLLIIRTARKDHACFIAWTYERTGHENWKPAEGCTPIIVKGSRYVEYIGEAGAFESGHRYCAACALKHWASRFANEPQEVVR